MSALPSEEPSSEPFWLLLGVMIFLTTLLFLAVFFDDTIGSFDISNGFRQLRQMILGGILNFAEMK